jgi:hypothetical protein
MARLICNDDAQGLSRRSRYHHPHESRNQMPILPDIAGTAALAICESLLLALNDHKILPEHEIMGVLKDAAATHENAPPGDGTHAMHKAVAALINKIIDGGNSVRRL